MNTTLGIDVGSHTIKLIEVGWDNKGPFLVAAGKIPTPAKVLGGTTEADMQAQAATIQKLIKQTNIKAKSVNVSLPESQVFTRVIEVPQLSRQELASSIKWEAEQYIPLPLDQVTMDFSILREAKDTGNSMMQVLLVAAPKVLIDRYVTFFEMAGLGVSGVETEIISACRALTKSVASVKTAMIVSLGAQTTDLAITRGGVIAFTRSISAGGEALSRALVQGLGFHQSQAEEYKKAYGLDSRHLEGKIVEAVAPIMDTIISEIRRAVAFYKEKYANETVEVIILSGGTARIPGMVIYMTEHVGIEAQLANPWVGVTKDKRFAILDQEGPVYCVAAGLAYKRG